MIISFKYNFIFFKTVKVGGTSFEIALSKYADVNDVITPIGLNDEKIRTSLGFRGPQNYLEPPNFLQKIRLMRPTKKFFNHISAQTARQKLGKDVFDRSLKVSIIRNPFDLTVSRYFWGFRDNTSVTSPSHFKQWLLARPPRLTTNREITHIDGECVIDLMLRFEAFDQGIEEFCQRTGLPNALYEEFKSIRAKGHYRPRTATTKDMFNGFEEGKKIITEIFGEELEKYKYACP